MGTTWSVTTEITSLDENADWSVSEDLSGKKAEVRAWCMKPAVLNPNAAASNTISNFGGLTVDELNVAIEDLDILMEDIQGDFNEWTISSEPE